MNVWVLEEYTAKQYDTKFDLSCDKDRHTSFRANWKVSERFIPFSLATHATPPELYIMGREHTMWLKQW